MKPWIGCEIRLLRSQLGWSRTELARHLGCSPLKVVKMEADEVIPVVSEKTRLEALSMDIGEHLGNFHKQVQAEAFMNEKGVEQVRVDEVGDDFAVSSKNRVDIGESID